ncbi:MAG TPA: hypothetical protein VEM13_13965 [Gemmatimonadales bacterium]|nr:hypothetical protein [Gemmatimonadales bacterium]
MTRDAVLAWLEARRPRPPDAMEGHLEAAVADGPPPDPRLPLPDHLALVGARLLARVTARPAGGRELAPDLLAADAFVTYAFEAQAEADVTGLAALAQRITGGTRAAP